MESRESQGLRARRPYKKRSRQSCTGAASGCLNHRENQYQLPVGKAVGGTTYAVCSENGACGQVVVER